MDAVSAAIETTTMAASSVIDTTTVAVSATPVAAQSVGMTVFATTVHVLDAVSNVFGVFWPLFVH